MLRNVVTVHGRGLTMTALLIAWAVLALVTLFVAPNDLVILALPGTAAAALWAWPFARAFRGALLVTVVGVVGGITFLEVGIRWSSFGWDAIRHPARYGFESPPMRSLDASRTCYTFEPGFAGFLRGRPIRVNRLGYRGPEIEEAHPGVLRVMSFGSSITLGEGVTEAEAYPQAVARELFARTGRLAEGVNMGLPAYGLTQALRTAVKTIPRYAPDVVVVELRTAAGTIVGGGGPLPERLERSASVVRRLSFAANALDIIPRLFQAVGDRLVRAGLGTARASPAGPEASPISALDRGVEEVRRVAGPRVRLVLLVVRPMADFAGEQLAPDTRARLGALSRRTGALVVDTHELFDASELPDDFIVFPGDLHPNGLAHARFAAAIARAVVMAVADSQTHSLAHSTVSTK